MTENKKLPRELFLKGDLEDSPSHRRLTLCEAGKFLCALALSQHGANGQVFSQLRMLPGFWVLCFLPKLGALLSRECGSRGLCLYYQIV